MGLKGNNLSASLDHFDSWKSYLVEKRFGNYKLNVTLRLIYGYNDRPGKVEFLFDLDEDLNILKKDMPERNCIS